MKSREISFTKSLRFKIVVYSLLSIFMTVVTEGAGILILYQLGMFSRYLRKDSFDNAKAFSDSMSNSVSNNVGSSVSGNLAEKSFGPPGGGFMGMEIDLPDLLLMLGVVLFVAVALFIVYFLLLSRRLYVSLAKIAAGIETMAAGDLNTRVQIDGEDEFALIGEKLNSMALDISLIMENERKNERMKNNLITNVAHDLRTPLTSVIGYLDLLVKNPDLEEETKEQYMRIAYDKSLRLQKLIEDLFSYTKVSQGEIEPKLEPLDVVKLMEQMIDEFYPAFQEAGLAYEFSTSKNSIMVMADGNLLARAFSNLIGNAVKYGKDGKNIRIYIKNNEDYVSITVTNYGKVIPQKDLEYIFERFYRVENSRSEKTGGTGLGLAIARRIILMHGGTIKADSGMEGTTFEVILKVINQKGESYEEKDTNMVGSSDVM